MHCSANISITFCHKSLQHHCISRRNELNFHATPQCSHIAISVQDGAVWQCNAIVALSEWTFSYLLYLKLLQLLDLAGSLLPRDERTIPVHQCHTPSPRKATWLPCGVELNLSSLHQVPYHPLKKKSNTNREDILMLHSVHSIKSHALINPNLQTFTKE